MIRNIFFVFLLFALLISPVMGETNTLYYEDSIDSTYSFSSTGTADHTYFFRGLFTQSIASIPSVSEVYVRIYNTAPFTPAYYSDEEYFLSETFDFFAQIGVDEIGYGNVLVINHPVTDSQTHCDEVEYIFTFENYDVSGYEGAQYITIVIPDYTEMLHTTSIGLAIVDRQPFTSLPANTLGFVAATDGANYIDAPKVLTQTTVQGEYYQTIDYEITGKIIEFNTHKNGLSNKVSIIGNESSEVYYLRAESIDRTISTYNESSVTLSVTNPFTGIDDVRYIPETSTPDEPGPSLQDPAEFTAYIYDAQTGNLISWSCLNKTYSGEYALPSSTYDSDGVIQAVAYWDETDWALFTASATGYKQDTTEFNFTAATAPPGSSTQMTFHLVPDGSIGNDSYALSFKVSQEISSSSDIWTRSVDATVICDGEQHLTGPTGTTWFNVTAGDHPYTVAKNGFETVQGTVTVSGNMLQTVYLNLGPDTPTVDDPAGNETGEVGDEAMHTAVAEAYAQFGAFIPEAVMIACVLFLLSMFKKF